jgi:hypothetical protein
MKLEEFQRHEEMGVKTRSECGQLASTLVGPGGGLKLQGIILNHRRERLETQLRYYA